MSQNKNAKSRISRAIQNLFHKFKLLHTFYKPGADIIFSLNLFYRTSDNGKVTADVENPRGLMRRHFWLAFKTIRIQ